MLCHRAPGATTPKSDTLSRDPGAHGRGDRRQIGAHVAFAPSQKLKAERAGRGWGCPRGTVASAGYRSGRRNLVARDNGRIELRGSVFGESTLSLAR
jgi:hypothetical protein